MQSDSITAISVSYILYAYSESRGFVFGLKGSSVETDMLIASAMFVFPALGAQYDLGRFLESSCLFELLDSFRATKQNAWTVTEHHGHTF